jgi:hypothetical protein
MKNNPCHLITFFKHYNLLILLLIGTVSCSHKNENPKNYDQLSFIFDTVQIDSKDEILFLKGNLRLSDLSPDKKHLINFNNYDHTLEVINLDELVLERKIPFEKEGPNGTGPRFSQIQYLSHDSLYINNEDRHNFFNFHGEIIGSFTTNSNGFTEALMKNEKIMLPVIFNSNPQQVFGLARDYKSQTLAFMKIDFNEKSIRKYDLPAFDDFKNFHYTVNEPRILVAPTAFTAIGNNKVLFSLEHTNDSYLYDFLQDSLIHIVNQQQLTASRKEKAPPQELADIKEFHQVNNMLKEQVSFTKPIWDGDKQVFYRFSHVEYDIEETQDLNPKSKSHVYLSILDADFKLLAEHHIKAMQKPPIRSFVKDGKIWMYENIDDELGFVRISFK